MIEKLEQAIKLIEQAEVDSRELDSRTGWKIIDKYSFFDIRDQIKVIINRHKSTLHEE